MSTASSLLTLHFLSRHVRVSFVPFCFSGSLWHLPGWQFCTDIISPPNISVAILVFLKCRKELPSLTFTRMLVQHFYPQSCRLIVWTIRIYFWMLVFPLSLSDPS